MNSMAKTTIRYFVLPGIIPRLKDIFGTGFSCLSFYMARVLNAARLLPDNHPYLGAANFGRYGIHHVLGQAWKNLVFKKENTDQIIIFFSLMTGVVLLAVQMILFVLAFVIPTASAGIGAEFSRFFETMNPEYDLAFVFLDRVFGMPGLFNSYVGTEAGWPSPFHDGLHALFGYYNTGLAIVAFLIIIYYAIAITAETAHTGVPFGKRFNHVMAPIRLILALALLVPITNGMNSAQMITLYMAKWGSGLATNGWTLFTTEVKSSALLGNPDELVVTPNAPQVSGLIEFIFVAQTCRLAYELSTENEAVPANRWVIRPYVILPDDSFAVLGGAGASTLNEILASNGNRNITIRFGHQNGDWFPEYESYVNPVCGEIQIVLQDVNEPGAYYVQNGYIFTLLLGLWNDVSNLAYARNLVRSKLTMISGRDPTLEKPPNDFIQETIDEFNQRTKDIIAQGVLEQVNKGKWNEEFTQYGWGGAAIWYNKIAQFNGSLISSSYNLPVPKQYASLMELVLARKAAQNNAVTGKDRYNPVLANGTKVFPSGKDQEFTELFYEAQTFWMPVQSNDSGNFLKDAVTMLLGLEGIINIRENVRIHPLAQLVGIGRGLIESSVQNFGYTAISWGAGLVSKAVLKEDGALLKHTATSAANFFGQVAMLTLGLGFVLFYVLPFLPFLYFFIALTSWVKSIFEAMIGLPLWALSHIRIEGDGIGKEAMNGYYLIFEVFLNPILIIFGMLAGITIFSAQVVILNEIWSLVVTNVTGTEVGALSKTVEDQTGSIRYLRGKLDGFFFTCMYTVFVYLMGLASFKLVDAFPNKILRWLGASVQSYNETADSMADVAMSKSYAAVGDVGGSMNAMMLNNK